MALVRVKVTKPSLQRAHCLSLGLRAFLFISHKSKSFTWLFLAHQWLDNTVFILRSHVPAMLLLRVMMIMNRNHGQSSLSHKL